RQIASHYYPLTGPYASGDPALIEYQLLLMKYSGIDGVLIDWPGAIDLYDYAKNKANAEAFIARTTAVGLTYAVVYEDQNVNIALGQGAVTDRLAAGQADMAYARDHYFSQSNYVRVNGAPLLLVFGPQTFQSPADWQSLFSALPEKPTFLTLWGESGEAGPAASGEFAWVVENAAQLPSFYAQPPAGTALGAAYPGFDSFYAQGGWAGPTWTIAHDGTNTFASTLDQALAAHVSALQLVTWNDYGEGTVIEPTQELGFSLLTTLQQKLGVNLAQAELELALKLYNERKLHPDDAARQMQLDAAFSALAALRFSEASTLLQ
ncbi:MAG TPA: glycoside hydrolase family 71/99-like protein, partial [Polyangiaceae bacterium]|nr:glycoside hydrolase family 71/99-like protein [Polyangiaceae bacterium]